VASRIKWWKNGDHPRDDVEVLLDEDGIPFESEGKVVRRFRHPGLDGHALCAVCNQAWDVHGWVDSGGDGQIVHPGDDVITHDGGEIEVVHPDPMAEALKRMEGTD